jgi:hypothetical protein
VEFHRAESLLRGEEVHFGAAFVRIARHLERLHEHAVVELQVVRLAVAPDAQLQPLGERVHDGYAHAVQSAGNLVRVLVELAAGVQLGHDDLGGGALEVVVLLDVGRDAAAVVHHRDGVVGVDHDLDVVAVARQRLVDGVVHHLEHHVVQARAVGRVADVHAGALAHGIEPLEDLDARRIVLGRHAAVGIGVQLLGKRRQNVFLPFSRVARSASASRRT